MIECSFNADTRRPGVHRCTNRPTHEVLDRRPLPDGAMRPPMPACERHAMELIAANPTAYVVTFGLWAAS